MFTLLLLLSKIGMLVAMINSTERTVTISKNLTEQLNITNTYCGEQCNVKCHLLNRNLDALPLCLPSTIEDLDLSFNNITEIGDQALVDLSKLHILSLSHNGIKEIHWRIHILAELESLDLSNNQLSVVPKCLMLKNLKKLSLAGNPILLIHPLAFSCFPNLESLNLSSTLIGSGLLEGIAESAFAINATQAQEDSLKSLQILDLSGTYIKRVNHSWSKDISNLKELYIQKMKAMEVLEDELIAWFPHLKSLNGAGSKRLYYIRTDIFENATDLIYLNFQNCNLRNLSSWNISSGTLTLDLRGNPLTCNCELDWLLSNHRNLFLIRPNETFCTYPKGDVSSISLLQLQKECKVSQYEPNFETQDPVTSSTSIMESDFISGTTEDSLNSARSPHTIGQKYFLLENTTNFMTTVFENGSASANSLSGTQSGMVTPNSSFSGNNNFLSKELTSTTSTTNGPLSEHKFTESGSSNGDQSEIPRDYQEEYDEEEAQPSLTTVDTKMTACDYDHCKHLQTPCAELQLLTSCMCPGLSGVYIIPDPPHMQGVFEITDTSAQILWCSPNSIVDTYQLVYQSESGRNETIDNIYVSMRQYTLYNLVPHTTYKVCVLALNKKGHSVTTNGPSRTPCTEFQTRPSYILILSIVSALGGLFLVTIAVLSVCLYKTCKNNTVSKYDTHLVSYKNPAFEYHCTIPSYH